MKKLYKIFLLLSLFVFLTTYTPSQLNIFPKKENIFLKVKNIKITNNNIIKKRDIEKKLTDIYGKNIFFIKRNDLEEPLKKMDFLEKIEVKKKYPNTIIIKVYETKPLAILFKNNKKYLLDSSSKLINLNKSIDINDFPSIFGADAEDNFVNFFNELENNNFPIHRVKNYYYFQIGRWDIQLLNDQIIKFPSNKTKQVIKQSVDLLNRDDFKNYNIIDLRAYGKIVVE